jgi:hypothetical protein
VRAAIATSAAVLLTSCTAVTGNLSAGSADAVGGATEHSASDAGVLADGQSGSSDSGLLIGGDGWCKPLSPPNAHRPDTCILGDGTIVYAGIPSPLGQGWGDCECSPPDTDPEVACRCTTNLDTSTGALWPARICRVDADCQGVVIDNATIIGHCLFAAGCKSSTGLCDAFFPCTGPTATMCGCDATTIMSVCPSQPYAHAGACGP